MHIKPAGCSKRGNMSGTNMEETISRWLEEKLEDFELVEKDLKKHARTFAGIFRLSRQDLVQDIREEPQYPQEVRRVTDGEFSLEALQKEVFAFEFMKLTCLKKEVAEPIVDELFAECSLMAVANKKEEKGGNPSQSQSVSPAISSSQPVSRSELEMSYTNAFPALPPKANNMKKRPEPMPSYWPQRSPLRSNPSIQPARYRNRLDSSPEKSPSSVGKKVRTGGKENECAAVPAELKKKSLKSRDQRCRRESSSSSSQSPKPAAIEDYLALAKIFMLGLGEVKPGMSSREVSVQEKNIKDMIQLLPEPGTTDFKPLPELETEEKEFLKLNPFELADSVWDPSHVTEHDWWTVPLPPTDAAWPTAQSRHLPGLKMQVDDRPSVERNCRLPFENVDSSSPSRQAAHPPAVDPPSQVFPWRDLIEDLLSPEPEDGASSSLGLAAPCHDQAFITASSPLLFSCDGHSAIWSKNYACSWSWSDPKDDDPTDNMNWQHEASTHETQVFRMNNRHEASIDEMPAVGENGQCEASIQAMPACWMNGQKEAPSCGWPDVLDIQISDQLDGCWESPLGTPDIDWYFCDDQDRASPPRCLSPISDQHKCQAALPCENNAGAYHDSTSELQRLFPVTDQHRLEDIAHGLPEHDVFEVEGNTKGLDDSVYHVSNLHHVSQSSGAQEQFRSSETDFQEIKQPFEYYGINNDGASGSWDGRLAGGIERPVDQVCGCCRGDEQREQLGWHSGHVADHWGHHQQFQGRARLSSDDASLHSHPPSNKRSSSTSRTPDICSGNFILDQYHAMTVLYASVGCLYCPFPLDLSESQSSSQSFNHQSSSESSRQGCQLPAVHTVTEDMEHKIINVKSVASPNKSLDDADQFGVFTNLQKIWGKDSVSERHHSSSDLDGHFPSTLGTPQRFCSCQGACNCLSLPPEKLRWENRGDSVAYFQERDMHGRVNPSVMHRPQNDTVTAAHSDLDHVSVRKSAFKNVSRPSYPMTSWPCQADVCLGARTVHPCLVEHASEHQLEKMQRNRLRLIKPEESEKSVVPDVSILDHPDIFTDWCVQVHKLPDYPQKVSKETQTADFDEPLDLRLAPLDLSLSRPASAAGQPAKTGYVEKHWKDLLPLSAEDMQRDFVYAATRAQKQGLLHPGLDVSALEGYQFADFQLLTESSAGLQVPQNQAVYVKDLEKAWLSESYRRLGKNKGRRPVYINKPCSFFLEGSCYRFDCKFSHDINTITCHFWEMGECFKGELCPFLHGYCRGFTGSGSEIGDEFDTRREDFPELTRKDVRLNSAPAYKKRKSKKHSVHRLQLPRGT